LKARDEAVMKQVIYATHQLQILDKVSTTTLGSIC
jgi:hypothetical protein